MAQEFPLRNYAMQNGLAHDNVFRIMQDKRGFLFFATNYGISVFDGKSFQNYTTNEGLTNNCIISISEDESGIKYISTYGGGLCTMNSDGAIKKVQPKSGKLPTSLLFSTAFGNSIWIIGLDTIGYRLFRLKDGSIEKVKVLDDDGKEVVFFKEINTGHHLLFATNKGIYRMGADLIVRSYLGNLLHDEIKDIHQDIRGDFWACTNAKVIHLNEHGVVDEFPFPGELQPSAILPDHEGRTWVGTVGGGLFLIENGQISSFSKSLHLPKIIINDIICDKEGSIWIATHGEGVYRLNPSYELHYAPKTSAINVYCNAITPIDDHRLLIGSIGMISLLQDDSLSRFPTRHIRPADFVYFLSVVDGQLYYGTPYGLFKRSLLPPYAERVILYRGVAVGSIAFFKDKEGRKWIGGYNGLYQIKNDSLVFFPNRAGSNERINSIAQDAKGTLWLGTDNGLASFDQASSSYSLVNAVPGIPKVNSLLLDSYGRLWVATTNGLYCKEGAHIQYFSMKDSLLHNACQTLAEEKGKTLWIGTMNGLSYADLNTLQIHTYQAGVYPNQVLSLYVANSKIYAGLVNGLSVLLQKDTKASNSPPPLYIKAVRSGNKALLSNKDVSLSYADNKLSIEFIGVSFLYSDRVQYRYRIENLDDGWHITSNNAIELPALPSGKYTLVVNARVNPGTWGSDLRLNIDISTPYWRTWWFRILAFLVIAVIVILFTRWKIKDTEFKKREKLSVYNKINYLKQQALSALINPHFIFNCMNSIQHFLNRNDKNLANDYLADFALLIRMTMEHAQEAFIPFEQEIARIRLYLSLEQLRCGNNLVYEIFIDPSLDATSIRIPNMMLQPYIENAIWHGVMPKKSPGKITVRFEKLSDEAFKVIIRDDGKGIDKTENLSSLKEPRRAYGRQLTQERLALLSTLLQQNYHIQIGPAFSDPQYPGVSVEITLPIYPKHQLLATLEYQLNSN